MFELEQFYGNIEYKLFIGSKKNNRISSVRLSNIHDSTDK